MSSTQTKAFGTNSPTDNLKEMTIERRNLTANDIEIEIPY